MKLRGDLRSVGERLRGKKTVGKYWHREDILRRLYFVDRADLLGGFLSNIESALGLQISLSGGGAEEE